VRRDAVACRRQTGLGWGFGLHRPLDQTGAVSETAGLAPTFRVYLAAVAFIAAGYADFTLIAYHFGTAAVMPTTWIPIVLGMVCWG
jgi:hypothetical protein